MSLRVLSPSPAKGQRWRLRDGSLCVITDVFPKNPFPVRGAIYMFGGRYKSLVWQMTGINEDERWDLMECVKHERVVSTGATIRLVK